MIYCGTIFFALYCYQFEIVNTYVNDFWASLPKESICKYIAFFFPHPIFIVYMTLPSIGLQKLQVKSISMLPYVIILLLSIFQLKNFQSRFNFFNKKSTEPVPEAPEDPIWLTAVKNWLQDVKSFVKRFSILHTPKLLLVLLFVTSQNNLSMIGVMYFFATIILLPIPTIVASLWFFLLFYSQTVLLSQYIYQFPYFTTNFNCGTSRSPVYAEQFCKWFNWVGLKNLQKSGDGTAVSTIFIDAFFIALASLYQRICNIWEQEMIENHEYKKGVLIVEADDEYSRKPETFTELLAQKAKFILNHFYENWGYEVR